MSIKKVEYKFDAKLFQDRLTGVMEKKGIKNAELADQTGVSAATISNYRNGNRKPRGFDEMVPISKALNVSMDYLAGVADYNYLVDSEKGGAVHPRNYLDAVRLATITSILPGGKIYTNDSKTVTIVIEDDVLWSFINQENKLFEMLVDGSLSERAFSIALDDLRDRMKETPLPEEELPFD